MVDTGKPKQNEQGKSGRTETGGKGGRSAEKGKPATPETPRPGAGGEQPRTGSDTPLAPGQTEGGARGNG